MTSSGHPVKDISINNDTNIEKILEEMEKSGGFESRNVADGVKILSTMLNDKKSLNFLSFIGAIISTGFRGIIKDMIKNKWFDVVITTCGALDHDIARHYSEYKEGSFTLDDKQLAKEKLHRLGNVIVPLESYGPLIEEKMSDVLENAFKNQKEFSTSDITHEIGKTLGDDSFLYWAYKNEIPVIVPGIMDGAVGSQIWMFKQKHQDFVIDVVKDSEILSSFIFKAESSGALMLGGGVPKHHTLWWNQYRGGLDYAVYITTAQEFDGSLSGALVREAISWGKVTDNAKQTTIHAEITTVFPFIYSALLKKVRNH
tara:strand:+ start:230 stop:1171 length:942 start_codon:yes stop_codon:yes gene_type:complete